MSGLVAAIGARADVQGFGLAGALVLIAEDPAQARAAWAALPAEVDVVILTRATADALGDAAAPGGRPLATVLP